MTAVVFIGTLLLITLGLFVGGFFAPAKTYTRTRYSSDPIVSGRPKLYVFIAAGVLLALTFVVWFSNSAFNVTSRTIGVVTEFGKTTDTVEPGFQFLAPWAQVTEFPTSTQNLDLDGSDGDDQGRPVRVKFDGGGTGSVDVNINWAVQGNDEAKNLYNQWKEFDRVTDVVVTPRAKESVAAQTGKYLPEDAVKSQNYANIARDIKTALNEQFANKGIRVTDVNILGVNVDKDTQARINKRAAARSDVDLAKTRQEKAVIDNETKKKSQATLTGPALVQQCLDMVNNWSVAKNGHLPAGFSCFSSGDLPLAVGVK